MLGYIVSINAMDVNNKHVLDIFGRLEDGRSFVTRLDFELYFYVLSDALESVRNALDGVEYIIASSDFTTFNNNSVSKLIFRTKEDMLRSIKLLKESSIPMFEQDIKSDFRFLLDHDIYSVIDIDGEENDDEFCDVRFRNAMIISEKIKPQEVVSKFNLSVLSIDIETTRDMNKVLSIALYDKVKNVSEVYIIHDGELDGAICVKDEYALLELFFLRVREIDPDVLVGWNFVDFDLAVLRKRSQALSIPFALGRISGDSRLRIESSFFKSSRAYVYGRQVVDGIWLLKHSFVVLEDYKLDTAAREILGSQKLKSDGIEIGPRVEEYILTHPQLVVDYNILDAKLVIDIFEKSNVLSLAMARSSITALYLSEMNLSIKALDSLYLRELVKQKKVSPVNNLSIREYSVMGGYVKDPDAGLYDNVVVLDFKSLYPSVMRTFNIDPLSYVEGKDYALTEKTAKEQGYILAPNGARFKNVKGILPGIIESIWKQRDLAKLEKDNVASYAFKILMNSLWGAIASSSSRFFSLEMANAITGFCQKMIKYVAERIEVKYGLDVIYGDTDSVFILSKKDSLSDVRALGENIVLEMNLHLQKMIESIYGRESILELEFEKVYVKYFVPEARGSEEGAKKRYAGLIVYPDGTEKMDFVGLEYVRSDSTLLVKKFQYNLLERLFKGRDLDGYIRNFVSDLRNGKYNDDLIYKKSLRKPIEEYTKTTPPHVKAAKKIPGGVLSKVIRYYITINGPEPVENFKSNIDYDHYVEKQIKPVAKSILSVVGKDVEEVLTEKKQSSLFDF